MTYKILANKWRPKSLDEIIGQEEAVYIVKKIIQSNSIHHAFLISGEHGTGKTTLARIITKCVNCKINITVAPCNKCICCTDIDNDNNIDSIEIDAASKTKVEEIRNVMDFTKYKNIQNRFKTYIIDECHMLSISSFNSILKRLEEPKTKVIYILVTTHIEKIPPTIISRCININLKKISQYNIKNRLLHIIKKENFKYNDSAIDKIALFSNGSMRYALNILEKLNKDITERKVSFLFGIETDDLLLLIIKNIFECNYIKLIGNIKNIIKRSKNIKNILTQIQVIIYKIALYKLNINYDKFLSKDIIFLYLSKKLEIEDINVIYDTISNEKKFIKTAPDDRIFLEILVFKIIENLNKENKKLKLK